MVLGMALEEEEEVVLQEGRVRSLRLTCQADCEPQISKASFSLFFLSFSSSPSSLSTAKSVILVPLS